MNPLIIAIISAASIAASIPAYATAAKPPAPTAKACIQNFTATPNGGWADGSMRWDMSLKNSCSRWININVATFNNRPSCLVKWNGSYGNVGAKDVLASQGETIVFTCIMSTNKPTLASLGSVTW